MTAGPPSVPGGRSPEEREAARREREARRGGRTDTDAPRTAAPSDWLAEAERVGGADGAGADGGNPRAPHGARRAAPERRGPRRGRFVAAIIVGLLVVGAGWFLLSLFQPFKGDGQGRVDVVVPQGASLGEIADLLERNRVISSSRFFQLRARLAGRSGGLKPGHYHLRRDMRYTAVLDRLEQGLPPNVVRVTIPEGLSRREAAPLVKGLRGNYLRATRRNPNLDPRDYQAKGARSLEGFLFPATYELKKGKPVRSLVAEQLAAFKRSFARVDLRYARTKNLTPYDVLIIASMVEREALLARERPIIASVIYNRLRNDIRLDIDATVRFVVHKWNGALTVSELENQSPYNTRVHPGLPPGPIGNPGLASIKAAAHPARTGYLFYVTAVCGNGRHRFAKTDAEFQRYVDEYNRARAKRGGKSPADC
jgi:UPF0755 protein